MTSPHSSTQAGSTLAPAPVTSHPVISDQVKRLVLTGFMGAGKSTVGRLLAARAGWDFLDLDALIEQRTGSTVPELFAQHGEAHFRRLESTALASTLARPNTVLALGGGAPGELTNRLLLEQAPGTLIAFLDAPFPALYDRCMMQDLGYPALGRPILADPAAAELRFTQRRPFYSRLSHLTIDTSAQAPNETVDALLSALSRPAIVPGRPRT